MNTDSHILFNKSLDQCRRLGARGGRVYAINCRMRRMAQASAPQSSAPEVPPESETAAEAIAALDAQFPWLRGAENRSPRPSAYTSLR